MDLCFMAYFFFFFGWGNSWLVGWLLERENRVDEERKGLVVDSWLASTC